MNTTNNLTSGRLLARNTLMNLAGDIAPLVVAVAAIPVLIHGVGVDRYGILTLVMLAVGYFGLFNFGLGRAATRFIAEAVASGNHSDIPGLFWTSLFLMSGFGVCGAILAAALSPWMVGHLFKIAPPLQAESLHAFYLLALSLPFVISGGSLGGTLSAFQRFDLTNAVGVPTSILYYVAPLLVLPFSRSLGWIVTAIVLVRVASWVASFLLCLYVLPELRQQISLHRPMIRPLLGFGGLVNVSGVAQSIMEYADRFIIGAMLSVAAVAYYAVPYQITNKLRVIPAALSGVVFPAFSASFSANPQRTEILFERATRYIILALFPAVLMIVTLAPEGLTLWLGPSFAGHSSAVMRWLAIAVFINSLAWPPFALLQAARRPDLTAKLNLVELPAFILLLLWALARYGVEGAAAAYAVRSAVNAIVLFTMASWLLPNLALGIVRIAKLAVVALPVLVIGVLPMALATKSVFLTAMVGLHALSCWAALLEPEEKEFLRGYLRTARVAVIGAAE